MSNWTIWYENGFVDGNSIEDWLAAPDTGVQVVVVHEPYPLVNGMPFRPWAGVDDRMIWTGDDEYSIYSWPVKYGLLIGDEEYLAIWEQACGR